MVSFFGVDVGGVYIISLNNIVGIFVVNFADLQFIIDFKVIFKLYLTQTT